jgi:GPH family glycoside/pentoside/hexuronide:cation symporter
VPQASDRQPAGIPTAAPPPLPKTQKGAYGFGGFISGFALNAPNYLANPIYNLALGLNPVLIGVVIAISRFWDGVTDPLFGYLSDNARTRWGRRKPFMLVGALCLGVVFALMWWLPRGASKDFYFWWFLVTTLLFYTASSTFLSPWTALGIEMTADYNERTNLNAYSGICFKIVGMSYAWLFPLAQLAVFQDTIEGVRYVGLLCGTLLTLIALVPVFVVKEKALATAVAAHKRQPFFASMKAVCSNRTFLQVSAVSVLTMTSLMTVSSLALYINIYHVFGGDKVAAAKMAAYFGMWFNTLAILSVPLVAWLGRKLGKHRAIMLCLGVISFSAVLKFFTYTPAAPWAQMITPLLHAPGLAAYIILINSMTADLVDYDEFCTGERREALLAAANHWLTKMGMSLSYIAAGLILSVTGFEATLGHQQPEGTVLWMRILFCAVPALGTGLALFILAGYPLTQQRVKEIQDTLIRRRHGLDRS